jgi:branched-chain amino acid transport system ATP-binding protein
MSLLAVEGVDTRYGQFQALFGIDLHVEVGEAVSIIGANGAGKSTLLKTIAGVVSQATGDVKYKGASLAGIAPAARLKQGISLVPEGRKIFPSLSVDENLQIGGHAKRPGAWTKQKIYETFPLLAPLASRSGARLSGGEQQMLAIGRALMSNPELLLLDEISLGLAPVVVKQVYAALPAIRDEGTTLLIVEQDVNQALAVASRFYCLLEGRVSLSGTAADADRQAVTDAYFGLSAGLRGAH